MKPPFYIETLSRNGEVLHRQQVTALPIRLGRGYDNDIILDDAHTAARHAVIEAHSETALLLRDLGSENGSIYQGRRHASILLDGDSVVRLGHTSVRVRGADYVVAPALTDTTMHGWEGAKPALAGLTLVALVTTFSIWLDDTQAFDAVRYLLALAYGLGGALLWGAVWAFGNRLFGHHARLGRHLFILGCGLVAMEAWKIVSNIVAYAYSLEALTRYGNQVLIAILACMIFFHLSTIKPRHRRRFGWISLTLLILGSGLNLMSNLQLNGRLADEPYMSVLLAPALRQSPNHTLDQFFDSAALLKSKTDLDRNKALTLEDSETSENDESE